MSGAIRPPVDPRQLAPVGPDEMGRELAGGPAAVRDTLEALSPLLPELQGQIAGTGRLWLVGTGASLCVARTVARLWRPGAGRSVVVRESSSLVLGRTEGETPGKLDTAVLISKSGNSPETLAAAQLARHAGAVVIAVTAAAESLLTREATFVVQTPIGEERGAATKSVLAAAAALLAMAGALPGGPDHALPLDPDHALPLDPDHALPLDPDHALPLDPDLALIRRLEALVADWATAVPWGRRLARARHVWFLGFGPALGVASAGALLWHEKVRRPAVATSPSEFRHGFVEAAGPEDAIVVIDLDDPDPVRAAYLALLEGELRQIGPVLVPVSPVGVSRGERVLAAMLRLQQLARATAHAAGTYQDGFNILRSIVIPASIDVS